MPLGSGDSWDETNPTNSTLATSIDDYDRDLRIGVRSRMALEHEWPTSQSATNQAGQHKFVTLQNQAAKPTVSGTQLAAVYSKTVGAGLQELFYENEAGTEVQLTNRTSPSAASGSVVKIANTGTSAVVTGTATIPFDDTPPQITEGFQVISFSYTPAASNNAIFITAVGNLANSAGAGVANNMIVAVHADYGFGAGSTSDALAVAVSPSGAAFPAPLTPTRYIASIGTTGVITFSLRAGNETGATAVINGTGSTRKFGGAFYSGITIYEIKA